MNPSTDRIEKQTVLRAPRERVWRAISDVKQFGTWFGVEFNGPFVAGAHLQGRVVPTKVDKDVAKSQDRYAGTLFSITVDRIEPMNLFSFRWHPFALEPGVDYSSEPTTVIVFQLEDAPHGTKLTIVESGFDKIPLARRAKAFAANDGGWTAQMKLIEKYLLGRDTTVQASP
jgi:uncharacterized protein YndB with AHSA1/START domain